MPSALSRLKPPSLRAGDTVGIVAPASNVKRELLDAGCQTLKAMGYKPFYFDSILEKDLYFAGSVERRTRELETMFEDDNVRAIVCARGGYGANYLLRSLDLRKIVQHPKIFVGYSDITTLLTYFSDAAGLITFHGPMAAKDFATPSGVEERSWRAALESYANWEIAGDTGAEPLVAGVADGELYGGCLSMLVASLGTPYEIVTDGKIIFIEDIATKPFQVDRMLMHLKLAGKLDGITGLIFGEMIDCNAASKDCNLKDVILRIVRDLGIPVAFGFRSGHVSTANITLPIGVAAHLEVGGEVKLEFLESATSKSVALSHSTKS